MRIRFVAIVLVILFLVACSSTKTTLQPDPTEQPLFTDADLDRATLGVFSTTSVDVSSEISSLTGAEVDESTETVKAGEITAQAVLPGATGIIAYIRYTPTAANPYSVILFDQATDVRTVVYSGKREIDSVAIDSLGAFALGEDGRGTRVVFSARQTINITSDFEIYELRLDTNTVTALTDNTSNDTSVSISADAGIIAWEGLRSTTGTRQIQWLENFPGGTLKTLNSSVNDTMPSISGDGDYLVFIRTLSTGIVRVQSYRISTSTLTTISNSTTVKRHPSVSNGNGKVAWTEVGTTSTRVYVQDIATGTRTTIVANANGIEHAHLRQDGKYLTYGLLQSGKWQLYTRNLTTNTSIKGVGSATFDTKGMFWASSFLDKTFGNGGFATTDFFEALDFATSLVISSDGKIVVAGTIYGNENVDMGLVRYNSSGSLDTNFGTGGKVVKDFGWGNDYSRDIAIDNNDKIVLVGAATACEGCAESFGTSRYNTDGSPDNTFSLDGSVTTNFTPVSVGGSDEATAVAIDSGGEIVVAGTAQQFPSQGDFNFGIARYDTGGSLDPTFGTCDLVIEDVCGLVTTDLGLTTDGASAMLLSGNKIIVAGVNSGFFEGEEGDFAVTRYLQDGSSDISFSGDGIVITDFTGGADIAYDAVVDSNGKLIIVGAAQDTNDSMDAALVRYNTDGSLDSTFGTGGKVNTDIGGVIEAISAVSIDSNGKIVVAGTTNISVCEKIFIARYNADGTIDLGFGLNGKYIPDFGACVERASDLAIDSNGKLVVVGTWWDDFLIARFNP